MPGWTGVFRNRSDYSLIVTDKVFDRNTSSSNVSSLMLSVKCFEKLHAVIDDALLETDINQPLLQFINFMNFRLVDPLLHSPTFSSQPGTDLCCWGQRSGEMNADISRPRKLNFLRSVSRSTALLEYKELAIDFMHDRQ